MNPKDHSSGVGWVVENPDSQDKSSSQLLKWDNWEFLMVDQGITTIMSTLTAVVTAGEFFVTFSSCV